MNKGTFVASLFLIINDRINVLLSLVKQSNESETEKFDPFRCHVHAKELLVQRSG